LSFALIPVVFGSGLLLFAVSFCQNFFSIINAVLAVCHCCSSVAAAITKKFKTKSGHLAISTVIVEIDEIVHYHR